MPAKRSGSLSLNSKASYLLEEAPEGILHLPCWPESKKTVVSIVGLARESKISRAKILTILAID